MTTNTIPTDFDEDREYVERVWPAARPLLADPMPDDAAPAARKHAIDKLLGIALRQRDRNDEATPQQTALIAAHIAGFREAYPQAAIPAVKGTSPLYRARLQIALGSSAAATAQLHDATVDALDSVCSATPHANLRRGLRQLQERFEADLEAEIESVPPDARDKILRAIDGQRIEEETAGLKRVGIVPDAETVTRWPRRLDGGHITVPAVGVREAAR